MMRVLVGLGGLAAIGWGLWLITDDGPERWRSQLVWFVGGVLAHDAVLAPLVVLLGALAARLLRPSARRVAAVAFIVWATVTVAVANVLLPVGGRVDNPSLMHRPYVIAWLALSGVLLLAAALAARRATKGREPVTTT